MPNASLYEHAVARQRAPGRESAHGTLDLIEIVRLATLAASSHNSQPWTFRLEMDAVTILPDFSRRCPVVDPDDGHLFKSLGCAAKNAIHAAAAQGYAANVDFEASSKRMHIAFQRSKATRAGELFHAIPHRQCTKLPSRKLERAQ